MAALNESAQAARSDSRRLRGEAHELRLAARGGVARAHERVMTAHAEADRARARRLAALPSPWSELRWVQSYDALERTLVPLP